MQIDKNKAVAVIKGNSKYPEIKGSVIFLQQYNGVTVAAEVYGLPDQNANCNGGIFGFHIHEGESCTGNTNDEFADAMRHYNPGGCEHPYHAGDMPPLFSAGGYAYARFLTNRFTLDEILNKTVIIHSNPDDFTTQPGGNSGDKIACGKILRILT